MSTMDPTEKRLRALELTFTLCMTRLQKLMPPDEILVMDHIMEGYLQSITKAGSPIMEMLTLMETKSD